MKKQSLLLITLVAFTAFFVSCKKNNTVAAIAQCRIVDVKTSDTTDPEIILDYDSSKRLSTITHVSYRANRMTFQYIGNTIIRRGFTSSGTLIQIDTIHLATNRLISSIVYTEARTGAILIRDTMAYDSKNQITTLIHSYGNHSDVSSYSWDNGDVAEENYNGISTNYTYYTDKNIKDGDLGRLYDILDYGMPVISCKHLIKGNTAATISYKFDSDGKITEAYDNYGSKGMTYDYSYVCD